MLSVKCLFSKIFYFFFLNCEKFFFCRKNMDICTYFTYTIIFFSDGVLWMSHTCSVFKKCLFRIYLILVAIDIVSNVSHETDLVRCRSCQKTAEPLSTPDRHQTPSSAATTCNWIGFWLIPSKYTARLPPSFLPLRYNLGYARKFSHKNEGKTYYLLKRNLTTKKCT